MMALTLLLWSLCTFLLVYLYVGFPLMLGLFATLFNKKHQIDEKYEPSVTLIISAYNEEAVIREKIENSKALDYPADKLNILVVSDCSEDRTDSIVGEFCDPRIKIFSMPERRGKTAGLNCAIEQIHTDLVVFSDANAMYDPKAIRKMVRHFADPTVGYVVGHARYVDTTRSSAGESENLYWNIETRFKKWESDFHSVVGGDGAIYTIRRTLYQPLESTDINDFVNPLQIVAAGYRGIFDQEAFCTEEPASNFEKEFGRKVRIANRSFNGFLRVSQLINPFRYGRFSWLLFSHKVLRWFSPFILLAHFLLSLMLPLTGNLAAAGASCLSAYFLFIGAAFIGLHNDRSGGQIFVISKLFYYFILMNVASAFGIISRLQGQQIVTWSSVRNNGPDRATGLAAVIVFLLSASLLVLLRLLTVMPGVLVFFDLAASFLFLMLLYVIGGYPLLLKMLHKFNIQPHRIDDQFEPTVTLLIPSYNEAATLTEKLENSLQLDYPRHKLRILVVSDGSTDETNAITATFADQGIELLTLSTNQGKITALNQGFKLITSEVVVLSDANVIYSPSVIRKLVRHFTDPSIGAVSGKVSLLSGNLSYALAEKKYYGIEHEIQRMEGATGSLIGADGAMYALRRNLYSYPPADTILDDFVISMGVIKQGYRLIHEPEAIGVEYNTNELKNEFQRKVRIVSGGIQSVIRRHAFPPRTLFFTWFKLVSHKMLRWIIGPLSILLLLLVFLRFQISSSLPWPLTIVVMSLAICTLLGFLARLSPGLKRFSLFILPYYLMVMVAASFVGCWRGLLGNQTVTWKRS